MKHISEYMGKTSMNDLFEGTARKERGIAQASRSRSAALDWARSAAKVAAASGRSITADDIQELLPESMDLGNAAGAIFRGPDWVHVGYTKSRRPGNHARVISVWRLAQ